MESLVNRSLRSGKYGYFKVSDSLHHDKLQSITNHLGNQGYEKQFIRAFIGSKLLVDNRTKQSRVSANYEYYCELMRILEIMLPEFGPSFRHFISILFAGVTQEKSSKFVISAKIRVLLLLELLNAHKVLKDDKNLISIPSVLEITQGNYRVLKSNVGDLVEQIMAFSTNISQLDADYLANILWATSVVVESGFTRRECEDVNYKLLKSRRFEVLDLEEILMTLYPRVHRPVQVACLNKLLRDHCDLELIKLNVSDDYYKYNGAFAAEFGASDELMQALFRSKLLPISSCVLVGNTSETHFLSINLNLQHLLAEMFAVNINNEMLKLVAAALEIIEKDKRGNWRFAVSGQCRILLLLELRQYLQTGEVHKSLGDNEKLNITMTEIGNTSDVEDYSGIRTYLAAQLRSLPPQNHPEKILDMVLLSHEA